MRDGVAADVASIATPLLIGMALNLVAAAVIAGPALRRGAGVALSLATMLVAWWIPPEHTLMRPLCGLVSFVGVMRAVDLARGRWSLPERLIHVASVVDTRRLVRVPASVDGAGLARGLAWQVAAGVAYLGITRLAPPVDAGGWLARWTLALVFVYTFTAGTYRLLEVAHRAIGFVTPPLHLAPAMARSVQEFWGERWNRTVSTWLGETFFRPFARKRRPATGIALAFVVSAALHAYLAWVGVGVVMALWMLAFFLLQAVIVAFERLLSVRAWPRWAGHVWTVTWMVSLSPLFDEGFVRVVGY